MHWPSAHGEVIALLVVFKARKPTEINSAKIGCLPPKLAISLTFRFIRLILSETFRSVSTHLLDVITGVVDAILLNYYLLSRLNMKHICLILRNRFCVSLGRVDKSHSVNEQCFKLCRLRWYSWSMPAAINVDYLGRVNVSITFLMFFYDNKVSFGTITRF